MFVFIKILSYLIASTCLQYFIHFDLIEWLMTWCYGLFCGICQVNMILLIKICKGFANYNFRFRSLRLIHPRLVLIIYYMQSYYTDERLIANGFRIKRSTGKIWCDMFQMWFFGIMMSLRSWLDLQCSSLEIIAMTNCIPYYGIGDLKEILGQ